MITVKGKDLDGSEVITEYTNYTVMAWLVDKRCNDNCRLITYDTESYDDAIQWVSKLKKCYGDSVLLLNRIDNKEESIELRKDQMLYV